MAIVPLSEWSTPTRIASFGLGLRLTTPAYAPAPMAPTPPTARRNSRRVVFVIIGLCNELLQNVQHALVWCRIDAPRTDERIFKHDDEIDEQEHITTADGTKDRLRMDMFGRNKKCTAPDKYGAEHERDKQGVRQVRFAVEQSLLPRFDDLAVAAENFLKRRNVHLAFRLQVRDRCAHVIKLRTRVEHLALLAVHHHRPFLFDDALDVISKGIHQHALVAG